MYSQVYHNYIIYIAHGSNNVTQFLVTFLSKLLLCLTLLPMLLFIYNHFSAKAFTWNRSSRAKKPGELGVPGEFGEAGEAGEPWKPEGPE